MNISDISLKASKVTCKYYDNSVYFYADNDTFLTVNKNFIIVGGGYSKLSRRELYYLNKILKPNNIYVRTIRRKNMRPFYELNCKLGKVVFHYTVKIDTLNDKVVYKN